MSTATSSMNLKQIKAASSDRINGKIKIQNKADTSSSTNSNVVVNGSTTAVAPSNTASTTTNNKSTTQGGQNDQMSPDQRRRVSGRTQMTAEEQKIALRKRVEQFIPTLNVRNSTTNILAKYKDAAPSLIVHLHPTHFRFDQQDGVFSYNSPMKAFLEYIRDEQIPPEVADVLKLARIKYYDVEVRDHRPRGQPPATTSRGPFITPSQNSQTAAPQPQSQPQPAPAAQTKEAPRTYRTLLRPTEQSLWQDFGQLADTSGGEFTDWMGLQVEGGLMLAMLPRLVLDLPRPGMTRKRIFERVFDTAGTGALPPRKKAKRESSKAADDSAERAAEEKLMLLGDTRHDRDFQPRFSLLAYKEEYKKRKAEEEKTKPPNAQREATNMPNMADIDRKPKAVTIDTIQAQAQQVQARLSQLPNGLTPGPNPVQLAQHAAQQNALAQVQAAQAQGVSTPVLPATQRRIPLPRVASQEQISAQAARAQPQPGVMQRQLQPSTATSSNAPTPISSSPQVPMQRLPATPRNVPGTPRPPGTPQPPQKLPTPQPSAQAMTPASSQPSPMLKSASQAEDAQMQQVNGARQFVRGPQGQIMNGVPQARPSQQLVLPFPQFLEVLNKLGVVLSFEQFQALDPRTKLNLNARVQEVLIQQRMAAQGNAPPNPVQGAYQQAQSYLQQAQRVVPLQPGRAMTPEQQRLVAQSKPQFMGADPEMIRQQLAQQGRLPPAEVQAVFQQQLLARQQQQAQQQQQQQQPQNPPGTPQQNPQAAAMLQRQLAMQQNPQVVKNPLTMTPQQVQMYRAKQIQMQQARAAAAQQPQQQHAPQPTNIQGTLTNAFMNHLSQEEKDKFKTFDGPRQAQVFQDWLLRQQAIQQQQQQQAGQHPQGPGLQYNPMAAQNMAAAGRLPAQMIVMGQGQGGPNTPTMMRQSTSGGGN